MRKRLRAAGLALLLAALSGMPGHGTRAEPLPAAELVTGMTADAVRQALGEPGQVDRRGDREIWQYRVAGEGRDVYTIIWFTGGSVAKYETVYRPEGAGRFETVDWRTGAFTRSDTARPVSAPAVSVPVGPAPTEPPTAAPVGPYAIDFLPGTPRPDDVAVIIGNSKYARRGSDVPDVVPAGADAAAVRAYVQRSLGIRKDNIIEIANATGAQLVGVFGSERDHRGRLYNWVRPGVSNVFVYYAGHGAPGRPDTGALLVPVDVANDTIELVSYPLRLLLRNLEALPARSVTVVLEACFSGLSSGGTVGAPTSGLMVEPRLPKPRGRLTVLAAGAADQVASWGPDGSYSLFTRYFLEGMAGAADRPPYGNGNGRIVLDELERYFSATVSYDARRNYGRTQVVHISTPQG